MTLAMSIAATASEPRWPIGPTPGTVRSEGTITAGAPVVGAPGPGRLMLGWVQDAGWLLLLGLAFPLAVLVVGTPVALFVRLLIEIGRRW